MKFTSPVSARNVMADSSFIKDMCVIVYMTRHLFNSYERSLQCHYFGIVRGKAVTYISYLLTLKMSSRRKALFLLKMNYTTCNLRSVKNSQQIILL